MSVLGKRTRGGLDLQEQQQQPHSTRRCTRRTRNFQQGNDENEDPESTIGIEAEDQSESEEVAFFSPSVTRTPSARRTKDIFKFEAPDYREFACSAGVPSLSPLTIFSNSCQGPHNTFYPSSPRCLRQSACHPSAPGHVRWQAVPADDTQDPSDTFNIANDLPPSSTALLAKLRPRSAHRKRRGAKIAAQFPGPQRLFPAPRLPLCQWATRDGQERYGQRSFQ